ncbi:MAG: gliding motility-associated ABC transporter substrate-binding protein GldG [Bacteroidia bacterium]|nr:gliding motility-associated ABC transporter substrate-binding protein GldG [Bacteroidia bacterium]
MSKKQTNRVKGLIDLAVVIAIVLVANLLGSQYYTKFDLTKEKRFTLSETSKKLAASVDDYIYIKVYLNGELSSKFKQLKNATLDMLSNYREASGNKIEYEFSDPFAGKDNKEKQQLFQEFEQKGLPPYDDVDDADIESQKRNLIIPGAEVFYGTGKSFVINLLKTEYGQASEVTINQSIENLEYEIAHAIRKCKADQKKRIGFLIGHGELGELPLYDLKKELGSFYRLDNLNIDLRDSAAIALYADKFTDNDEENAKIILSGLQNRINQYDAVVIAKPRRDLTKEEAFLIDQYMMQGGNTLWFIDALQAEMDSMSNGGRMVAVDYPLDNLRELLFHYGIRVNVDLLQDFRCNDIALRDPYSANSYRNFPWVYFPVFTAHPTLSRHPINRNIEGVWSRFGGTLKILNKEDIKATPLLISSDKTRISNAPALVEFSIIDKIRSNDQSFLGTFNGGPQVAGVLLEGTFKSAFARRNVRSDLPFKESGKGNIIVIADGDIARNHVSSQGGYLELGKDHITGRIFGNKKFLLNCFDYLLDDSGLIEIRSKEIILRLLDKEKVKEERTYWQFFNLGLPVLLLVLFGVINAFIRKKKYASK